MIPQADPCIATTVSTAGEHGGFHAGRYAAATAPLISTATPQIGILDDQQNTPGNYNDGGIDNIRLLDVTPRLDAAFASANLPSGTSTILTLTVTNTSELLAKTGWAVTETLPSGLTVAGSPSTDCGAGTSVSAAPGGSAITVTGGRLGSGTASCAIQVPVTAAAAGSYTVDATAVTGLDAPGAATVTFTSPRPAPSATGGAPAVVGGPSMHDAGPPRGPTPLAGPPRGPVQGPRWGDLIAAPTGTPTMPAGDAAADPTSGPDDPDDGGDDSDGDGGGEGEQTDGRTTGPHDRDDGGITGQRDQSLSTPAPQSVFTGEVPSIWEILKDPSKMAAAIAMGLVWTLLLVVAWISRTRWRRATVFRTSPWGLVVGMLGVVVSRLIASCPDCSVAPRWRSSTRTPRRPRRHASDAPRWPPRSWAPWAASHC